jgi:hypothetical protein
MPLTNRASCRAPAQGAGPAVAQMEGEGDRPPAGALDQAKCQRARRLRAQRGLLMRQPGAWRSTGDSLWDIRLCHYVRDNSAGPGAGCNGIVGSLLPSFGRRQLAQGRCWRSCR